MSFLTQAMLQSCEGTYGDMFLVQKMVALMGVGPAKFGPVQTEMMVGTSHDLQVFDQVSSLCTAMFPPRTFTDAQILRAVQFTGYKPKRTMHLLKRMDPRYFNITALELENQLMTKTLFPIPGLSAHGAQEMFYMRPSRYFPGTTRTSTIIANLTYVMDSIYEKHRDPSITVGLIANMEDWTMENFSFEYCLQFMEALQGRRGPNRVNLFLIVNPPNWFDNVWSMMKPMLSPGFRKRVHMIKEQDLDLFLLPGFQAHLPDEFEQGSVPVDTLVREFVAFRMFLEAETKERVPNQASASLIKSKAKQSKPLSSRPASQ